MSALLQLPPNPPKLRKDEFDEIRSLAYRSFGLDLKPGKEEMVSARLGRLVVAGGHGSYREYARSVAADGTGASLAALIDALTTNHTSFLREPDHFDYFRQNVAPKLAERAGAEIWCAACSSGEEVWTLACIWNETNPGRKLRIHATDISNKVLAKAKSAEYTREACATLPASWLSRYFERMPPASPQGQPGYRVGPLLRSQTEFRRLNLMQPLPWSQRFPAIFCRNVMIYFDRPTQQNLVHRLTECLEPGGFLFTGHAESLAGVAHGLEYVQPALYRKSTSWRAG